MTIANSHTFSSKKHFLNLIIFYKKTLDLHKKLHFYWSYRSKYASTIFGKLYIEATDIDELCVCMTYTQLSLLGLSVRVIHGNSLSGEIFSTWDSPNLQMANLTGYFN